VVASHDGPGIHACQRANHRIRPIRRTLQKHRDRSSQTTRLYWTRVL